MVGVRSVINVMPVYEVCAIAVKAISQPKFVFLYQLENFFVGYGVLMANNNELLFVFNELANILSEQGERRVGNNDV